MYGGLDPGEMAPEEREKEVAGILAQDYLRLHKNGSLLGDSTSNLEGRNSVTSNISNGCAADKSAR